MKKEKEKEKTNINASFFYISYEGGIKFFLK